MQAKNQPARARVVFGLMLTFDPDKKDIAIRHTL
jgi:hypothetical protein